MKGLKTKFFVWLNSFELWMLAALITMWLDTSITLIGTHYLGLGYEGNPIVIWAIQSGAFYMPLLMMIPIIFAIFGTKYLWHGKIRAARVGVKIFSWLWVPLYFYLGPLSWLSFVYL